MKLKEFKEIVNRIHPMYDNVEVSFICHSKEYFVRDIENDIEWYEDDMNDNIKRVDITVE